MGRKFLKSCPAAPPVSRWMSASKCLCWKEFGCHLVDLSPHQLVEQSCLRAKGRAVLGPEEKKNLRKRFWGWFGAFQGGVLSSAFLKGNVARCRVLDVHTQGDPMDITRGARVRTLHPDASFWKHSYFCSFPVPGCSCPPELGCQ